LDHGQVREMGMAKEVCEHYLSILRETQAGVEPRTVDRRAEPLVHRRPAEAVDQRLAFVNQTRLRNDLELFHFRQEIEGYGTGAIRVVDAGFEDEQGRSLHWIVGGELVVLVVRAVALADIDSPIIGFFVKDRLGQNLFGDNTYLSYVTEPRLVLEGQRLAARFSFRMPVLPVGDYAVDVAVASGTQQEHVTHCWCSDVLIFKSHASSVHQGLVGIPMLDIAVTVTDPMSEPLQECSP
jgi:lipopolysaccharide transport system ATP-binding protein